MTDLITARAVRFIEQHAAEPFFLDVAYNAAHWPFQVPDHPSKAPRVAYQGPLDADRADAEGLRGHARAGGRRRRPDSAEADRARARAEHARHLHQRQRRRVAVAERAAVQPKSHAVGRRHPRAGDFPLARPAARRQGQRQVGITMDLTASILAATNTPVPAGRQARRHQPAAHPRRPGAAASSARCSGARPNQKAVRRGDWKLLVERSRCCFCSTCATTSASAPTWPAARIDVIREMRPLIAAWEADVDAERKAADR